MRLAVFTTRNIPKPFALSLMFVSDVLSPISTRLGASSNQATVVGVEEGAFQAVVPFAVAVVAAVADGKAGFVEDR
jgi:hypothetical protein